MFEFLGRMLTARLWQKKMPSPFLQLSTSDLIRRIDDVDTKMVDRIYAIDEMVLRYRKGYDSAEILHDGQSVLLRLSRSGTRDPLCRSAESAHVVIKNVRPKWRHKRYRVSRPAP